jgi:hypothetical protein
VGIGAMSEPDSQDLDNLTGVWNGMFKGAFGGSILFLATLIESGSLLTGATHEPCAVLSCPRKTHNATLSGHRRGRTVSFIKTYDPLGYGYDAVAYSGDLNADASEIAGMWTIAPDLSGEFLMVRATRRAATRARKKAVTV